MRKFGLCVLLLLSIVVGFLWGCEPISVPETPQVLGMTPAIGGGPMVQVYYPKERKLYVYHTEGPPPRGVLEQHLKCEFMFELSAPNEPVKMTPCK